MELELKHIAPYLPYGLNGVRQDGKTKFTIAGIVNDLLLVFENGSEMGFNIRDIKPILRPLESITIDEATEFGNVLLGEYEMKDREAGIGSIEMGNTITPILQFRSDNDYDDDILVFFGNDGISCGETVSYEAYDWLFKHHFDIFGLINKGLAIAKEA